MLLFLYTNMKSNNFENFMLKHGCYVCACLHFECGYQPNYCVYVHLVCSLTVSSQNSTFQGDLHQHLFFKCQLILSGAGTQNMTEVTYTKDIVVDCKDRRPNNSSHLMSYTGSFAMWLFSSHQEVDSVFSPLESKTGFVACLGRWNVPEWRDLWT